MKSSKWSFLSTALPIIQAPMAGAQDIELAIAVAEAGGLGSLPCAMLSTEQIESEVARFRACTDKALNLNFFCHRPPVFSQDKEEVWRDALARYYKELNLDPNAKSFSASRKPFDETACALVEKLKPEFVSFHFGLPADHLLARVKNVSQVLSSATTVAEGRYLESKGCDAVIAQGLEAGGHRGHFLTNDISNQMGTIALVPLLVDALKVPIIASGGISDARGVRAAFALGASAVQVGTAYLLSDESRISEFHRQSLLKEDSETALTNLFSGRPARGIYNRLMRELGPMSHKAPEFPLAGEALAPLKEAAQGISKADFSSLWAGQAVSLVRKGSAKEITLRLASEFSSP